jgi:hypothetical protein
LLASKSHTTEHTFIKIPHHSIYYANHQDGTAHAGYAFIIKSTLKHYELGTFITNNIQGTIPQLEASSQPMVIAAVYSAPRYSISVEDSDHFLSQLGKHHLVAGDWNAKHTAWGSRLMKSYSSIISITFPPPSPLIGPLMITESPNC